MTAQTLEPGITPKAAEKDAVRIMRIATRLNIGGPARQVTMLSSALNHGNFRTCLVTGQLDAGEEELIGRLDDSTVHHIVLKSFRRPIRLWDDLRTWLALVRLMWQERPRVLHTHMAKAGTLGRSAAFFYNAFGPGRRADARILTVHTFHGHVLEGYFPGWLSRLFVTIERWVAQRTDCLIAVSPSIRDNILQLGIGRQDQWRVIPLGLDLEALAQIGLPDAGSPLHIGMVGRLVPIKNPRLFLSAIQAFSGERTCAPIQATFVGDGPLRGSLEKETERLGLADCVKFIGWQRNLAAIYAPLNVACVTSWNEGTPVALIEAMAAGRAVVSTDVGGVRDLLEDERSPCPAVINEGSYHLAARGILVRSGDVQGLVAAFQALAADPALRQRLAGAGRKHVFEHYVASRLLRDIEQLYGGLAGRE